MVAVPKEELISESMKLAKLEMTRLRLEKAFHQSSPHANLIEEYNEIILLIDSIADSARVEDVRDGCYLAASKLQDLTDRYCYLFTEKAQERNRSFAKAMALWGDAFEAYLLIPEDLQEDSSFKGLKAWSKWIDLLAELTEDYPNFLNEEVRHWLEKLAKRIMRTTAKTNPTQTRKNYYKRSLRRSASLILIQIQKNHSPGSSRLVVGSASYEELLNESQKRIHNLDDLEPETEEEATEQEETLDFLLKELADED